jgi:hypothetical protein
MLNGFNTRDYDRLWHRGASCPEPPTPCARSAAVSQEVNKNPLDGALIWLPGKRDSCDDVRGTNGENGTVVSLENNAAVPLLFAALADRAKHHSYFECLQGQGSLLPHPVCRYPRPLPLRYGPLDTPVGDRPERFKGLWTQADSKLLPPPPPPTIVTPTGDGSLNASGTQATLDGLAGAAG